jgi:hypothetical protein
MLQKNIEQWRDIANEIIIVEGATKAQTGTSNYLAEIDDTGSFIVEIRGLLFFY